MPILPFVLAVAFFLIINLFLALFLASMVSLALKFSGVQVETIEMNFLIFIFCASIWMGIRVILLNFSTFENFTSAFIWPMQSVMPKDLVVFLNNSTAL